jgi:DNA modification methylase
MATWETRISGEGVADPSTLLAHPENWRRHPDGQREQMTAVLEGVGWIQRVIVNKTTGRILDGHLRVELAQEKGEDVPVIWVELSAEEERLALATFDFLSSQAEIDKAEYTKLIEEIEKGSVALLETLKPAIDAIIKEYRIGKTARTGQWQGGLAAVRAAKGDLWLIEGGHKLLCGDSTLEADVDRLFEGQTPLMMVTDPPYGVDYHPEWRKEAYEAGLIHGSGQKTGLSTNDSRADWGEAFRLFPGDVCYVWHADKHGGLVFRVLEAEGFEVRAQIIWAKAQLVISRGHYNWQHECCYYAVKKGATASWTGPASETTLWQIPLEYSEETNHSAQKPVETAARAIRNHGAPGALIYDPFLGTGTTLIAAHRERRRCFGLEIEPRYCDDVLARCEAEGLSFEKVDAT